MPQGVDVSSLRKLLREEFGVVVAGGQGSLTGKIVRIGHLGAVPETDIREAVGALGSALAKLGYRPAAGSSRFGRSTPRVRHLDSFNGGQPTVAARPVSGGIAIMTARILVADPIAQDGIDRLSAVAEVDVKTGLKPDELCAIIGRIRCPGGAQRNSRYC